MTAVQLVFGLLCGLAMLTNNFLRLYAKDPQEVDGDWPPEIEVKCSSTNRKAGGKDDGFLMSKKGTAKEQVPFDSEGLRRLREALKDIPFRLPSLSFKSVVKGDAVWVLMVKANQGTQETVSSAKAKLNILDDAMTMPREAFRTRLENCLRENDFKI